MTQRTNNIILLSFMAFMLTMQAIRVGIAIVTGDWSNIPDILTIYCLAGAVIFRTLQLGSLQARAGIR